MEVFVAHSTKLNYQDGLYSPLRKMLSVTDVKFFLPHEGGRKIRTKEIIERSNLVIAEISFDSTPMGVELGWAHSAHIPIVGLHRAEVKPSESLKYVVPEFLAYRNRNELVEKIWAAIEAHKFQ